MTAAPVLRFRKHFAILFSEAWRCANEDSRVRRSGRAFAVAERGDTLLLILLLPEGTATRFYCHASYVECLESGLYWLY